MPWSRTLLLAACAALGCATSRPATPPPPAPLPAPTSAAPAGPVLPTGLDAQEVRRRLGEPERVERIPSAAASGAVYERWRYRDREVVLLDGKVIDVVP